MNPKDLELIEKYFRESGLEAEDLRKRMDAVKASTVEFNRELKAAKLSLGQTSDAATSLASSLRDSINFLSKGNTDVKKVVSGFRALESVASKFKYDMMDYGTMSKKEIERSIIKIKQNKDLLKDLESQGDLSKAQKAEIKDVVEQTDKLLEQAKKRLIEEKKIQKQLGLTGAIVSGITGALGKIGISSVFFDDLKEDLRDAAKSGGTLKVAFTGVVGLAKGLGEALTDPLTLMTFFVTQALKGNQQATNLGKSLGITYEAAKGLRKEFTEYARVSNDSFINATRLEKAQSELAEQLGITVRFSREEAETQARLTDLVGLTAEEGGKIAKFSAAAGMNNKDYVASLRKSAFFAMQTTKTHFSDKQILQDVSKLSAGILVKFQGNPDALAKAVVQAKKLGLTLDQVDKIGESLLNWETSIENELKAELITGKQLNFERARAAALTGDQATLMQEIASQAGSLEEFQNMNVVAQKSLAEAFGLSREEMSQMLLQQQLINTYGDKAKELNDAQIKQFQEQKKLNKDLTLDQFLQQQAEQLSIQEKFNNGVLKLQDIFGTLLEGPIGDLLIKFLKIVGLVADVLQPVLNVIFEPLSKALTALGKMEGLLKTILGIAIIYKGVLLGINIAKQTQYALDLKDLALQEGKLTIKRISSLVEKESLGTKIAMYAVSLKDLIVGQATNAILVARNVIEKAGNALKAVGLLLTTREAWKSIAGAAMSAFESAAKIPYVGWLIGGAAAAGAIALGASLITKGDDVMSEGGYGKRTLLAPEGAIRLNDNDTVIAGTDLGGGKKNTSQLDFTPVIDAINRLSEKIESRPINIKWQVDGKQLGTVLVQGSPKAV